MFSDCLSRHGTSDVQVPLTMTGVGDNGTLSYSLQTDLEVSFLFISVFRTKNYFERVNKVYGTSGVVYIGTDPCHQV